MSFWSDFSTTFKLKTEQEKNLGSEENTSKVLYQIYSILNIQTTHI